MAKRKSQSHRAHKRSKGPTPETLRRQGAEAFRRGDYELAIAAWRRISTAQRDPALTAAFAEACFRRGLGGHLDSLRQAVALAGDEPRYTYHLALAHHRAGRHKEAEPLYRQALEGAGAGDELAPRAAYALGLLLLETNCRPSRDPCWGRLKGAAAGSALAETHQRLAWAEGLLFARATPAGPAPDPLWAALAARQAGRDDPRPVLLEDMTGSAAAVAHQHLGARAWEQGNAVGAFTHWRAAHDAGLDFLGDELFAAARAVATERLKADDAAGALEAASAGLAVQPADNALKAIAAQAHFRLGHAAASAGRWDAAYEHWQAALKVGGERGRRLVINLALAAEQRDDWLRAAQLWREALRRRPRRADHPDALNDAQVARLWHHVAESYQRTGRVSEALSTFRNALKWAPDDVALRIAYVDMLLDDGRLWAADNQLETMLQAHPENVELLERRAQIYDGQGYIYAALRIWKRILELQPDHPNAQRQVAREHESLGDSLYRWGQIREALEHYQQGLEYIPDHGVLLVSVGMCHLDLGDEKLAHQCFERAYAAEPANQDVYLIAIKTWLEHKDQAAAQAVIERARQALGAALGSSFFLDLADYCYSWGRRGQARDYIAEARTLAAGDAYLLLTVADLAGRNGDYVLAGEIVADTLELDPDNALAHLIQGLALMSQGQLKAARRSWKRAEQIARKTDDRAVLLALEEIRLFYDPSHVPSLGLLRHMLEGAMFDDDAWPDDGEEWD